MKVRTGVIIDASKLGLGQLVGVVDWIQEGVIPEWAIHKIYLPRRVERELAKPYSTYGGYVLVYPREITATIPDCGEWLGKEMP